MLRTRKLSKEDLTFWTPERDAQLIELRRSGLTWQAVGDAMGLTIWTVIERKRRLPDFRKRFDVNRGKLSDERLPLDARDLQPLPPGHPLTWGAISNEPYPRSTSG